MAAHLAFAHPPVDEHDRYFGDAEPVHIAAVVHLDLEGVAVGVHRLQVEVLQDTPAEALEPAGQVADRHAQNDACVERSAAADEGAQKRPVARAAAGHPARADRCVRPSAGHRRTQAQQVGRIVRKIGVHLEDELGARGERAPESGDIGGA